MSSLKSAYLLIELAVLLGVSLLSYSTYAWKTIFTRRYILIAAALYTFWLALDLAALRIGIFEFPERGSLPVRILGLPIEEHLFFPIHTTVIWMLLSIVRRDASSQ